MVLGKPNIDETHTVIHKEHGNDYQSDKVKVLHLHWCKVITVRHVANKV